MGVGTVKFTNVNAINQIYFQKAIEELKDSPRGSWKLVQAFNKSDDVERLHLHHNSMQKNIPSSQHAAFVPPSTSVADSAGFIIWKDQKLVIFYSNDLDGTPKLPIMDDMSEDAIKCVYGLQSLQWWTGNEIMHQMIFKVPAVVVAYNKYMNCVDQMNQALSTAQMMHKEKGCT